MLLSKPCGSQMAKEQIFQRNHAVTLNFLLSLLTYKQNEHFVNRQIYSKFQKYSVICFSRERPLLGNHPPPPPLAHICLLLAEILLPNMWTFFMDGPL